MWYKGNMWQNSKNSKKIYAFSNPYSICITFDAWVMSPKVSHVSYSESCLLFNSLYQLSIALIHIPYALHSTLESSQTHVRFISHVPYAHFIFRIACIRDISLSYIICIYFSFQENLSAGVDFHKDFCRVQEKVCRLSEFFISVVFAVLVVFALEQLNQAQSRVEIV